MYKRLHIIGHWSGSLAEDWGTLLRMFISNITIRTWFNGIRIVYGDDCGPPRCMTILNYFYYVMCKIEIVFLPLNISSWN